MPDPEAFARLIALVAAVGLVAVASNRLTARIRLPAPVLLLAAAALVRQLAPSLHAPDARTAERLVTVALAVILFDGGMHIGWRRLQESLLPVVSAGLVGTLLTAGLLGLLLHLGVGLSAYAAALTATALAPTDPAVVFSVLGRREIAGRAGTILEGESGANDPVGIALMAGLLAAGGLGAGAVGHAAGTFALQLTVGAAVGLSGGHALRWLSRRPLPAEGLYPLRTLFGALALFGAAGAAHGSGFLAVFVAGIVLGDARAPYRREVRRFHAALGSLGEIVAFVVLGLGVDLDVLRQVDVWVPGLVVALVLVLVVRPLAVGLCLVRARLPRGERAFVLLAGLKGAVPILLGTQLLTSHTADASRCYGIVVVAVALSVALQGSAVPWLGRVLGVPMRTVEPTPWALGVRLGEAAEGVHRLTVAVSSPADGVSVSDVTSGPEDVWVSLVVRAGRLLPVHGDTVLHAGDEVLLLAASALGDRLREAFEQPREAGSAGIPSRP